MTMVKTVLGLPVLNYMQVTEAKLMKFSAVIVTIFLAATARAGDWAPGFDIHSLAALEVPAAAAVKAGPKDGDNYSGAEEVLIKEFGVTTITMDMPEAEVIRQSHFYQNAFCFEHALRLSLLALLDDYSSPTSPLAKALREVGVQQTPSKTQLKKARQKVMTLLNDGASLASLVRPYHQHQPLNGETVERNWIFFFRLGGEFYWALVDRAGERPVLVYGA